MIKITNFKDISNYYLKNIMKIVCYPGAVFGLRIPYSYDAKTENNLRPLDIMACNLGNDLSFHNLTKRQARIS